MMKRFLQLICIALCLLLLAGCQKETLPEIKDGDLIVYPGVSWNATPEEVLTALNLTENDITVAVDEPFSPRESEDGYIKGQYTFTIDGVTMFGYEAKVAFQFDQYTDGALGLRTVMVIYPDSADMAKVRSSIGQCLGTPTNDQVDRGLYLNLEEGSTLGHVAYWDSTAKAVDYIGQEHYQSYLDAAAEQGGDEYVSRLLSTPAVRLYWTDDVSLFYYGGQMEEYTSERYMLMFNAYMTEILQRYG